MCLMRGGDSGSKISLRLLDVRNSIVTSCPDYILWLKFSITWSSMPAPGGLETKLIVTLFPSQLAEMFSKSPGGNVLMTKSTSF